MAYTKKKTSSKSKSKTNSKKPAWGYKNYSLNVPNGLKYLLIHESPSEAKKANLFNKSIEKKLNGKALAVSTIWHFYTIPQGSKDDFFSIDEKKLEPKLVIDRSKSWNLSNIKKAYDEVKKNKWLVIIWSDPDREWEIIAYEVIKYLGLKKGEYKRLRIRDFSEKWYIDSLNDLEDDINWDMLDSWISRMVIDKLIGYMRTLDLWWEAKDYKKFRKIIQDEITNKVKDMEKKYSSLIKKNKSLQNIIKHYKDEINWKVLDDFKERLGIGVWRVKIPTLKLLVEKDLEKFNKELARKVDLLLIDNKKNSWEFYKNKEFENTPENTEIVYQALKKALDDWRIRKATVTNIKQKKGKISPPKPLDTQTAQSSINSLFGYSLKEIMAILQEGYKSWVHTYMRTDSIDVPEKYQEYVKEMLKNNWIKSKFVKRKYKSGDDAQGWHHAILPTKAYKLNSIPWTDKKKNVWGYVIKRTIASFLEEAEINYIEYELTISFTKSNWKDAETKFILKDKEIIKEWFLEVFDYNKNDYKRKFTFNKGDLVKIKDIILKEKDIKLPWTYTPWTLVKELKKQGIWRPSTWENIVSELLRIGYIQEKWKKIEITPKWYWLYTVVNEMWKDDLFFNKLLDLKLTVEMEKELDLIAMWKDKKNKVIKRFLKELNVL